MDYESVQTSQEASQERRFCWERATSGKEKENVSDPWGGVYLPHPTCVGQVERDDTIITGTVVWLTLVTMKWLACGLSLGMVSCHEYGRDKVWSLLWPYPCVLAHTYPPPNVKLAKSV